MSIRGEAHGPAAGEERANGGDASLGGRGDVAVLTVAGPWARYWARMFDLTCGALVLWLVLILPGGVIGVMAQRTFEVSEQLSDFWVTFFLTPVVVALDAVLYDALGNTPGKWLLGLRVLSLDGDRLAIGRALRRNFGMYVLGLGMALPVVPLFTLVRAYHKAKDGEPQPWDVATRSRCYSVRNTTTRTLIGAAITVCLVLATAAMGAAGE